MTYTKEDFENLQNLEKTYTEAKDKLTKRACEVYLRLMTEYYLLHGDESYTNWENLSMVAACKQELGKEKDSRLDEVTVEIGSNGISLRSEYSSQGETDPLYGYIDNFEFLYDDQAITDWIKNKIEADREAFKRYQEYEELKRQERLEEQEREEFENYLRLKAKYEGKSED